MSISTKTGDDGTTSLPSGERVPKSDQEIHFLGTLDELNSHIGLLRTKGTPNLEQIQKEIPTLTQTSPDLKALEAQLIALEQKLPPLKNFITPNTQLSAQAHIARTICRRAERLSPTPSPYLNRLSDYLFLVARKADI